MEGHGKSTAGENVGENEGRNEEEDSVGVNGGHGSTVLLAAVGDGKAEVRGEAEEEVSAAELGSRHFRRISTAPSIRRVKGEPPYCAMHGPCT